MRHRSLATGDEPPPPRAASRGGDAPQLTSRRRRAPVPTRRILRTCTASRAGHAPLLAGRRRRASAGPPPLCHPSIDLGTHQSAMDVASSQDAGERCREQDDSALSKASLRRPPMSTPPFHS